MNADQDCTNNIEDTLLLRFLITRYSEMLGTEEPNLVPIWAGLGMIALHQNRELENAFKTLISSDSYTAQEVIASSIDLFLGELSRLETAEVTDYLGKRVERPPLSRWTTRKFLYWSWSEGRKMSKEGKFGFYPIWEVVSWLALTSDEYLTAFEERCRFSESSPEKKIREGLNIVKAAIFKRRVDDTFYQPDMPTGTTN